LTVDLVQNPDDYLEILLVTDSGEPIRRTLPNVTRADVQAQAAGLITQVTDPRRTSFSGYLSYSQQLYDWFIAPIEADLEDRKIDNLSFIMDTGLRSLPIAALHDGESFLVEKYSLGLMPTLALTDTRYRDIRDAKILAMGASTFADQNPLPAVPIELSTITREWDGVSFLNEDFTPANLIAQRESNPYSIVHLATHGEFRPGDPSNSYIAFENQRLQMDQLRSLQLNDPPVDLLVLSACRTALGDKEAELGFAGFALQAGVKSVLASLWYVSDLGTLGFMSEFYHQL
jgi:CHAT domain-containing protein